MTPRSQLFIRYGLGNLTVAVVPLLVVLVIDYIYVRHGYGPNIFDEFVGLVILVAVPAGFAFVNWPLFRRRSDLARFFMMVLFVALASVLWFLYAFTIIMNFHSAIGGAH